MCVPTTPQDSVVRSSMKHGISWRDPLMLLEEAKICMETKKTPAFFVFCDLRDFLFFFGDPRSKRPLGKLLFSWGRKNRTGFGWIRWMTWVTEKNLRLHDLFVRALSWSDLKHPEKLGFPQGLHQGMWKQHPPTDFTLSKPVRKKL